MAVEKMKMLNVMGRLDDVDNVLVDILKTGVVNIVHSQAQINQNAFTFSLESDENLQKNIELNYVSAFKRDESREEIANRAKELEEFFGIKTLNLKNFDDIDLYMDYTKFYEDLKKKIVRLNAIEKDLKVLSGIEHNYELFENVDIDLKKLEDLKYFKTRFGVLDRDGRFRLKKNYGNLLAIIFHTATIEDREVYLAIYPTEVENEIDRILKSLNWQNVDILGKYSGSPQEILVDLKAEEKKLRAEREEILEYRDQILASDKHNLKKKLLSMLLNEKIEDLKKYMMRSKNYFYLSGWIGASDVDLIKDVLSKYDGLLMEFDEPNKNYDPPTKLKNPNFFKPFELLINMYGTPNYREVDPTIFLSITYMILFGAMFGDLGQGAVFLIVGFLIKKLKNLEFGALLTRLGISSMVFGAIYGSVFGSEELIDPLILRPFDNISRTLSIAIVLGIILLVISYAIGFVNKYRLKEYEELYFGKDGLSGFLLFLCILNFFVKFAVGKFFINKTLTIILIVLSLVLMIFKMPIYQKLKGGKVIYEDKAGYYIEGGFSLLETLMSILSNIISFVRVGAFAINHVGLYLAFVTLGKMMGSFGGNLAMLVIGNIIIIGLEGLIVFIQSLRLEYYEMFSKYYLGDGYAFRQDKISLEDF